MGVIQYSLMVAKSGLLPVELWCPTGSLKGKEQQCRFQMSRIGEHSALAYVDATLPVEQELEIDVRGRKLSAQLVPWHGRSEAPPYFRAIPIGRKPDTLITSFGSCEGENSTAVKKEFR